jgi:hypothetical protein
MLRSNASQLGVQGCGKGFDDECGHGEQMVAYRCHSSRDFLSDSEA